MTTAPAPTPELADNQFILTVIEVRMSDLSRDSFKVTAKMLPDDPDYGSTAATFTYWVSPSEDVTAPQVGDRLRFTTEIWVDD